MLALGHSTGRPGAARLPLALRRGPSPLAAFSTEAAGAGAKGADNEAKETAKAQEASAEASEGASAAQGAEEQAQAASGEEAAAAPEEPEEELQELRRQTAVLKEQLAELQEKHDSIKLDSKQQAKRHHTDLDNETKYGVTKFATALLQIPDNLERASSSLKAEDLEQDSELRRRRDNAEKAQKLVREALESFGVVQMDVMDKAFDPQCHEAMFAVPMPGKDPNTIFHIMESGYMIHERTLRAAKVGVVRGNQ